MRGFSGRQAEVQTARRWWFSTASWPAPRPTDWSASRTSEICWSVFLRSDRQYRLPAATAEGTTDGSLASYGQISLAVVWLREKTRDLLGGSRRLAAAWREDLIAPEVQGLGAAEEELPHSGTGQSHFPCGKTGTVPELFFGRPLDGQ